MPSKRRARRQWTPSSSRSPPPGESPDPEFTPCPPTQTPATRSGACEGPYLHAEARGIQIDSERQAARDAWRERRASIDAPPEHEVQPVYEWQSVRRTDPRRLWQTVEQWETVRAESTLWHALHITDGERQVLEQLAGPFERVKAWRSRVATAEEPERGSELAGASLIWPPHPTWEVARVALASSVDHLNLARVAIETRELFPTAHFTAIRGALVGGAVGVWALHPEARNKRQQPSLRVLDGWYQRRLQCNESVDLERLNDAERTALADQCDFLADRKAGAKDLWRAADGCTAGGRPSQRRSSRAPLLSHSGTRLKSTPPASFGV